MTLQAADPPDPVQLAHRAGRWVLPTTVIVLLPTLWLGSEPALRGVLALALLVAVAQVVWQDVASFTIADGTLLAIGLVGAIARLDADASGSTMLAAGFDAVLCGGAVWLVREIYYRRRGQDGIGMGDVKLCAAGGLLTGLEGFPLALLLASLAGLALVAASRISMRPIGSSEKLPFGAFLAPAFLVVWVVGPLP